MNFNYILFLLWSIVAIYWLHIEHISVASQQDGGLSEVLPQSVIQFLDTEPLGLTHSEAILVLLFALYIVTWFSLWLCFRRGKRGYGQLTDECQQLRKQETAGKRIAKIKEQEVNQLKAELRERKEKCLLLEDSYLTNLQRQREEQSFDDVMNSRVTDLEEKVKTLKGQKKTLEDQVRKLEDINKEGEETNRTLQGKVNEHLNSDSKVEEVSKNLQRKMWEQQVVLLDMMLENERLRGKVAHQDHLLDSYWRDNSFLEAKLRDTEDRVRWTYEQEQKTESLGDGEAKYNEMKKAYREQIRQLERSQHEHWFASVKANWELRDLKKEMAALRHMITDAYRKIDDYRKSDKANLGVSVPHHAPPKDSTMSQSVNRPPMEPAHNTEYSHPPIDPANGFHQPQPKENIQPTRVNNPPMEPAQNTEYRHPPMEPVQEFYQPKENIPTTIVNKAPMEPAQNMECRHQPMDPVQEFYQPKENTKPVEETIYTHTPYFEQPSNVFSNPPVDQASGFYNVPPMEQPNRVNSSTAVRSDMAVSNEPSMTSMMESPLSKDVNSAVQNDLFQEPQDQTCRGAGFWADEECPV